MVHLEEIVISKETRRHKTAVQKAIQALNYYEMQKRAQSPVSMSFSAKKFGITQGTVSKVLSLRKIAGEAVVQKLFNGDSVRILKSRSNGTTYSIESTSPDAIRRHYESLLAASPSGAVETIDALEMAYAQLKVTELTSVMSYDGISYLTNHLLKIRDRDKVSYDTEVVNKELGL